MTMKIEIKLKDPESCEGCPMFTQTSRLWDDFGVKCRIKLFKHYQLYGDEIPKRPKRCKEENGL